MSDDRLYLVDILERIDRIERYTQVGRSSFFESPLIQDAVIRNFEVMGEAVKQLSSELRQRYSEVRWRQIAGELLGNKCDRENPNRVRVMRGFRQHLNKSSKARSPSPGSRRFSTTV